MDVPYGSRYMNVQVPTIKVSIVLQILSRLPMPTKTILTYTYLHKYCPPMAKWVLMYVDNWILDLSPFPSYPSTNARTFSLRPSAVRMCSRRDVVERIILWMCWREDERSYASNASLSSSQVVVRARAGLSVKSKSSLKTLTRSTV